MRTLIAIPCLDQISTLFFRSFIRLQRREDTITAVTCSSLVYDARNQLGQIAENGNYDRVLWLDSDMVFDPDLAERFHADLDEGAEFVSALCFTRKAPIFPTIYKNLAEQRTDGTLAPDLKAFMDYPRDAVFEVAGCGFGACMMTADLIKRVRDAFGQPFTPVPGFGEDLSFCLKARELGASILCDSRIRPSHAGVSLFNQETFDALNKR